MRPKDADSARSYDGIVAAASELLATFDRPTQLTLRDVARNAGVSLGTIAYYFDSKDTLLEACLDGYYARLDGLASELVVELRGADLATFVDRATRRFFAFARQERGNVRLRLAINAAAGELPQSRHHDFLEGWPRRAADLLHVVLGSDPATVRFTVQSLAYLVARFAVATDAELHAIFGVVPSAQALEDHVAGLARRMLRFEPHDGESRR